MSNMNQASNRPGSNATESRRSLQGTLLAIFCGLTILFLVYRDLALPSVRNVEVWFGIEVRGLAAMLTAPLHWAIYALGAEAFWRNRPWIWRASIGYAFYIAFSHAIWNMTSASGGGVMDAFWQFVVFCLPALLLWRLAPD